MAVQTAGAAHKFALAAAELAANTRCDEVVVLDLRGKSPVTEYFVIATGTSPRQMRTAIDEVRDLGKKTGFTAWRQDGYESAKWIVLDCVNVVIHVFDVESRDFYDLELLWGDSPRVDWRKELGLPPALEKPVARDVPEFEDEDEDQDESPVEIEVPDESTGSNSVEFVEAESPRKRGKKGRGAFPSVVEEEEDATAEERAVGPLSQLPEAAADLEEEEAEARPRAKKAAVKKKAVKKAIKKVVKKAAPAKKVVAKKGVAKKTVKAAVKKAAPKKAKKAAPKKGKKAAVKGKKK